MNEQKIVTNTIKILSYGALLIVLVSFFFAITFLIFSIIVSPDIQGTLFSSVEKILLNTMK